MEYELSKSLIKRGIMAFSAVASRTTMNIPIISAINGGAIDFNDKGLSVTLAFAEIVYILFLVYICFYFLIDCFVK
jgi:hypothetical protein